MKQKLLISLFTTFSLLTLNGCGGGGSGMGDPYSPPVESKPSNSVPKKVNVDIPKALKNDRSSPALNRLYRQSGTDISLGYEELKNSIKVAEGTLKEVKSNLVLLDSMMPDIKKECKDTPVNTTCTIPARTISLTIGTTINEEIKKIDYEFKDVGGSHQLPLDMTLTMGEIHYTKYDSTHPYQYDINIDLKPTFSDLGVTVDKNLQHVKWSDDNSSIDIVSDAAYNGDSWNMHLKYSQDSNGKESMSIADNFNIQNGSSLSGTFNLKVEKLHDTNDTVKVASSGTFLDNENYKFNSSGQIDKNGGFLISKVKIGDVEEFASKESFDINGSLLNSKYCDTLIANGCDINDETTWYKFGVDLSQNSSNSSDNPNNNDNASSEYTLAILQINGGEQLDEGLYELLPKDIDLSTGDAIKKVEDYEIAWVNVFTDDNNQKILTGLINYEHYGKGMDLNQMNLYKSEGNGYSSPVKFTKVPDSKKPTFSVEFF